MRKIYKINGIDCEKCALEIEEYLKTDKNINDCKCDFATMKLSVDYKNKEYSLNEIDSKIKKIERTATLIFTEKKDYKIYFDIAKIFVSLILFFIATFVNFSESFKLVFYLLSYAVVGYSVVFLAVKKIFVKKNPFDENMLMTVATIGAFCIGEYLEACLVLILYSVGQVLEQISVSKTRNNILKTLDKRSNYVNKLVNGEIQTILAKDVQVNDEIVLKTGEILAIDGVVTRGEGLLDVSSLTGEFVPINITKDTQVKSGCALLNGSVTIRVENDFQNSTATKILDLVLSSKETKSKTDRFITKFAKYYTPIVFGLAVLVFLVPSMILGKWNEYLYRALSFLVIACPCAVIISVPLTFFTGLGLSAKNGILIKGANVLENMYPINAVGFDKTGTLTYGKFGITNFEAYVEQDLFKKYFASIEKLSNHPIAKSISNEWKEYIDIQIVSDFQEVKGKGVSAIIDSKKVFAGNGLWLKEFGLKQNDAKIKNAIYLFGERQIFGYVEIDDSLKSGCKSLFEYLKSNDIKRFLLSGDTKENGDKYVSELDFSEKYYNLLPEQKLEIFNQICSDDNEKVVYLGDGINDAPTLARANIGVSMGSLGSDLAVEASDMIIVSDKPEKLKTALKIAKITRNTALFNIGFALAVKLLFLIISSIGFSTMWLTVLADVGLTVLLVLNSMFLLFRKVD